MLGITNPYAFGLNEYEHYNNINLYFGYLRFFEVVLNRNGESNGKLALYFDGAVNYFEKFPSYDKPAELNMYLQRIRRIKTKASK